MNDSGVLAAVQALLAYDPDVADGDELRAMSKHSATLRAFVDYVDVRIVRRSRDLADTDAADTGAHALIDEGRLTGREARATDGRDRVCIEMPAFDEAHVHGHPQFSPANPYAGGMVGIHATASTVRDPSSSRPRGWVEPRDGWRSAPVVVPPRPLGLAHHRWPDTTPASPSAGLVRRTDGSKRVMPVPCSPTRVGPFDHACRPAPQ